MMEIYFGHHESLFKVHEVLLMRSPYHGIETTFHDSHVSTVVLAAILVTLVHNRYHYSWISFICSAPRINKNSKSKE